MTATLDTHLAGSPESILAVSSWLGTVRRTADDHVSDVSRARGHALDAWSGTAATAFADASLGLASAGGQLADSAGDLEHHVTVLADTLTGCLRQLDEARRVARAAGLGVAGTAIHPPPAWPPTPPIGGYGEAQEEALRAAHRALELAWQTAQELTLDARERWEQAIADLESILSQYDGLLAGYLVTGVDTLRGILDDLHRFEPQVPRMVPALPAPIRGYGLDVLFLAWNIEQDIAAGESTAQAVTSQGVGLGASIAGSALTGAAIGTLIGGPVGTVVGGLGGAVVGTIAGTFANGYIDGWWEQGNLGGAIVNGWNDLAQLGVDTWGVVTDVAEWNRDLTQDAIEYAARPLLDCWDALFD